MAPQVTPSAEPGQRDVSDVEQGAEESHEEEDLRGDAPEHTLAEGAVHLVAVTVRQVFPDYVVELAVKHDHQQRQAAHDHPGAKPEVVDGQRNPGEDQQDR